MKTLNGGTAVATGHYLHLRGWEIVPIPAAGGTLPGSSAERFVRLPTAAVFALTPVLGALFVMFLPVIGIVLTAQAMVRRPAPAAEGVLSPGMDPS